MIFTAEVRSTREKNEWVGKKVTKITRAHDDDDDNNNGEEPKKNCQLLHKDMHDMALTLSSTGTTVLSSYRLNARNNNNTYHSN